MMDILGDKEIMKAMALAMKEAQEYTLLDGRPHPLPERMVVKATTNALLDWVEETCSCHPDEYTTLQKGAFSQCRH